MNIYPEVMLLASLAEKINENQATPQEIEAFDIIINLIEQLKQNEISRQVQPVSRTFA
jgi:hypothetical protein